MPQIKVTPTLQIPDLIDVVEKEGKPHFLLKKGNELEIKDQIIIDERQIFIPPGNIPWGLPSADVDKFLNDDDGGLLLDIIEFLWEHVELPDPREYFVVATWIMMTWVYQKFHRIPNLFFYGPPATGKTRAEEVLFKLCWHAIYAVTLTEATVFRTTQFFSPTLLVDEVTFMDREKQAALISVLNARHTPEVKVPRINKDAAGAESVEWFTVFGPTAFAGTEDLTPTLRTRSITINMRGLTRKVERKINEEKAKQLRTRLLAFKIRHWNDEFTGSQELEALKESRHQDLFEPLYVIAERCSLKQPTSGSLRFAAKMGEIDCFRLQTTEVILRYAIDYERKIFSERQTGREAKLVTILLDLKENKVQTNLGDALPIALITKQWNQLKPENEKPNRESTIARWLSELGFRKVQMADRHVGILWDDDLIKTWAFRYGVPMNDQKGLLTQENVQRILNIITEIEKTKGAAHLSEIVLASGIEKETLEALLAQLQRDGIIYLVAKDTWKSFRSQT